MTNQEAVSTSKRYIEDGKNLLHAFQFAPAQKLFQKSLELDPNSIEAKTCLARLALMRKDKKSADGYLDELLSSHPADAGGLALKAVSLMQEDDWKGAIDLLEKARQTNPGLQMVYFNLATSHRKLGNLSAAENFARKAIELNEKDFNAHAELSYILARSGRFEEGIKEMGAALKINPYLIKGYLVLSEIHRLAGQREGAIKVLNEGLSHNQNALPLREALANLFASSGDYISAYRETLEIMKRRNIWPDFIRLGCYALGINNAEAARKAFQHAKNQIAQDAEPQELMRKICEFAPAGSDLGRSAEKLWNEVLTAE